MKLKINCGIIFLLFCSIPVLCLGQGVDEPKIVDTSLIPSDTTKIMPWEVIYGDTLRADTIPEIPQLNIIDSIQNYFLPERFELSDWTTKTQSHDAGDFLRFDPSNFIIDYQPVPMRKTVAPFDLPGDRINLIHKDRAIYPIEHIPEPDNRRNFEELPTAAVQEIYDIEGPLGMAFGGDNTTSSLILLPNRPKSFRAESGLFVDVGDFDYANTRAFFTERKKSGRLLQIGVEYRSAGKNQTTWPDSSYHHWADVVYPLSQKLHLKFNGRLFRRRGEFPVRPSSSQLIFDRNRRDRDFSGGFDYYFSSRSKVNIEARHQRSETEISNTNRIYKRDLDLFDNSVSLSHEMAFDRIDLRSQLIMTEEEFHNFSLKRKRHKAKLNITALRGDSLNSFVVYLGAEKVGGYAPAPSGMLSFINNWESFYLSSAIGYATKFPRQYELDLTPIVTNLIDGNVNDYYESGNGNLKPEKQLSGNLKIAVGKANNDLSLSITGGKIFDGIDWVNRTLDTVGLPLTAFKAENRDIDYGDITLTKRLTLNDNLFWLGGGSYHYISISGDDDPPYSPDYQAFTGLELHLFIEKLDLNLHGYIETSYVGPYHSYPAFGKEAAELGKNLITNMRLSFRIKSFRFYYYWQNLFMKDYALRDGYGIRDFLLYYGITWQFLD